MHIESFLDLCLFCYDVAEAVKKFCNFCHIFHFFLVVLEAERLFSLVPSFQVDFFNNELERLERKVTTPQLLKNEKQMQENLDILNSLREESLRKKFESQTTDTKQ